MDFIIKNQQQRGTFGGTSDEIRGTWITTIKNLC